MSCYIVVNSIRNRMPDGYFGPGITPGHLEGKVVAVLISKGASGLFPGSGGEGRACSVLMAHASNLRLWGPGGMGSCGCLQLSSADELLWRL